MEIHQHFESLSKAPQELSLPLSLVLGPWSLALTLTLTLNHNLWSFNMDDTVA